mmetsp:Transcript_17828/g.28873  ORF Transcript_17828/g.28873 Transcript_17828/m.28873 type:complete len:158 (-) Transcript_17828:1068-1541(-)
MKYQLLGLMCLVVLATSDASNLRRKKIVLPQDRVVVAAYEVSINTKVRQTPLQRIMSIFHKQSPRVRYSDPIIIDVSDKDVNGDGKLERVSEVYTRFNVTMYKFRLSRSATYMLAGCIFFNVCLLACIRFLDVAEEEEEEDVENQEKENPLEQPLMS